MQIPQLTTCCCGCSLKTGTKIIGWLSLICAALMLVTSAVALTTFYMMESNPPDKSTENILKHLPALKTITIFLIVVQTAAACLAFLLLMGTYQNKAKLIFYWVVIALTTALVEQALNLSEAIFFGQPSRLFNILIFVVDLYFILVVYSFYREIRNMSDYA